MATGAALPLLVLPFVTRALAPEDYGAWVLAYAFGMVVSALANAGLPMIYERSYFEAQQTGAGAALLWTTVAFVWVLIALALAATWYWRESLAAAFMQDRPQPELLFWTTCAASVASVKTYFLFYFRNAGDARRHALFSMQEAALGALGSVLLVAWFEVGPLGLAWGPLGASALVLALLGLRFMQRLPLEWSWRQLGQSLALAFPLLPRVGLGVFGQVFDKWLVGIVAATGGLAGYAIGQRLAYGVFAFSNALENVFQPLTYRLMFEGPGSGAAIGRLLTPFAYATVGVALGVGLAAEEALAILAPPSYTGATAVATVLAIYFAVLFFGKQPQLLYAKKTGIVSALSSGSILLNALLMWLFATRYGPIGAAAGTALGGMLTTAISVNVSQRYYGIKYESGKLAAMYAFLVLSLALVHVARSELSYLMVVPIKVGISALYAWAGLRFGIWHALARHAWPAKWVDARP